MSTFSNFITNFDFCNFYCPINLDNRYFLQQISLSLSLCVCVYVYPFLYMCLFRVRNNLHNAVHI